MLFHRNTHSCEATAGSFNAANSGCNEDNRDAKNGNNGGCEASAKLITPQPCGKWEVVTATGTGAAGLSGEKRKAKGK